MDQQELKETFQQFDRDQNGRIDLQEFRELLTALDARVDDSASQIGFESIDSDGSGTIDFDEFAAWWDDQ